MQEIYIKDDVHEMLENSASWVHMLKCSLQKLFHGEILLQDLQIIWWWKVMLHNWPPLIFKLYTLWWIAIDLIFFKEYTHLIYTSFQPYFQIMEFSAETFLIFTPIIILIKHFY